MISLQPVRIALCFCDPHLNKLKGVTCGPVSQTRVCDPPAKATHSHGSLRRWLEAVRDIFNGTALLVHMKILQKIGEVMIEIGSPSLPIALGPSEVPSGHLQL